MQGDCLERMKEIPSGSVDMILTDPPYGTTACKWDSIIPLEPMWEQLKRIIKPNGAIVMTASQPFTTALIASNMKMFKYCWYWEKEKAGNFQLAKKRAMKRIEEVCVFYSKHVTYNPQGLIECDREIKNNKTKNGSMGHLQSVGKRDSYKQKLTNYPVDRLNFINEKGIHEAQKPVALMEYLIKTYTNEGETVLDFTMGSGTTGVAAANLKRDFIGIELDADYFKIAQERIEKALELQGEK
jgi:site-specific DNA-methyltransferase (adenine-specific)